MILELIEINQNEKGIGLQLPEFYIYKKDTCFTVVEDCEKVQLIDDFVGYTREKVGSIVFSWKIIHRSKHVANERYRLWCEIKSRNQGSPSIILCTPDKLQKKKTKI